MPKFESCGLARSPGSSLAACKKKKKNDYDGQERGIVLFIRIICGYANLRGAARPYVRMRTRIYTGTRYRYGTRTRIYMYVRTYICGTGTSTMRA